LRIALLALLVIALAIGGWQILEWRGAPPDVTFIRVTSGTIASEVSTNGKVDPAESAEARAETSGRVDKILIHLRQNVAANEPLVELDTANIREEISGIEASIAGVKAELAVIDAGGKQSDKVALEAQINQLTTQLNAEKDEYAKDIKLLAKQSITQTEVTNRKNRIDNLQSQIDGFQARLKALVSPTDRAPLEARIEEFAARKQQAQLRLQQATIRAPIAGTIYKFDLKPGAYLNPGDVVASIGRLDQVHVIVYVDEPDLGRVHIDQPVKITWDAMPNREWSGIVNRLPAQIQPLNSRQVGEVTCIIENPNLDLLPGTNVTARILADKKENVLMLPKEAIFHESDKVGVYLLVDDHIEWRSVTQGINNVTQIEVRGLNDGDVVALPSDRTLTNGLKVHPIVR
jgi:HlyD family secretion protein